MLNRVAGCPRNRSQMDANSMGRSLVTSPCDFTSASAVAAPTITAASATGSPVIKCPLPTTRDALSRTPTGRTLLPLRHLNPPQLVVPDASPLQATRRPRGS